MGLNPPRPPASCCDRETERNRANGAIRVPGTIRTYIPPQTPLSTQRVTVPFWRERDFRTVLRKFRLRPGKFPGESPLNVPQFA